MKAGFICNILWIVNADLFAASRVYVQRNRSKYMTSVEMIPQSKYDELININFVAPPQAQKITFVSKKNPKRRRTKTVVTQQTIWKEKQSLISSAKSQSLSWRRKMSCSFVWRSGLNLVSISLANAVFGGVPADELLLRTATDASRDCWA